MTQNLPRGTYIASTLLEGLGKLKEIGKALRFIHERTIDETCLIIEAWFVDGTSARSIEWAYFSLIIKGDFSSHTTKG